MEEIAKVIKKIVLSFIVLNCLVTMNVVAQEFNSLLITPDNLKIVEDKNEATGITNGYHLYIKKTSGVESVMLTETTKDPTGQEPNYAYRAKEYNSINGDEIRMLNGEKLDSPQARYSLVDSTVEKNEFFDECFHIYIPAEIVYGYSWSRNGTVKIGKGTFINIRSFEKKYCDYTGKYFDNPYMFDFVVTKKVKTQKVALPEVQPKEEKIEEPEVILTDNYNPIAAHTFDQISDFIIFSKGPDSIIGDIMDSINRIEPKVKADVVFAIDATGSMKDDIQKLKDEWLPALLNGLEEFEDIRLGLLFYRDYNDNFNTKGLPVKYWDFTSDAQEFVKNVRSLKIIGAEGGDIPEPVYEALFASMDFYKWRDDAVKKVILIGDAEPHPVPRRSGKYSRELVEKTAKEKNIVINAIITPDDKASRGRGKS